jgi:DinB superfamily
MINASINSAIKSQFNAALDMLQQTIVKCPDSLWLDATAPNHFWHVAYHTLFFLHLYLQPRVQDFVAWPKHIREIENLSAPPWAPDDKPQIGEPYSCQDVLEYLEFCRGEIDRQITALDFEQPSGFHWLPFSKMELQFYNLRHLHQHIGELSGRLLTEARLTIDWVALKSS